MENFETQRSESELVVYASDGDKCALEDLIRLVGPRVRRRLRIAPEFQSSIDEADVMQVTYLECFLRVGSLRDRTPSGFEHWLYRIAQNNLTDAIRWLVAARRPAPDARLTSSALGDFIHETRSVSTALSEQESIHRIVEGISALPPSYRAVVQAWDLEELPPTEVAERLGRTIGAVTMLRSRAHQRLRELLEVREMGADSA